MSDELIHYGILRRSGRFPWGSGENPYQRSTDFFAYVDDLKREGLSEADIAKGIGYVSGDKFTTTELRATTTIAKNVKRSSDRAHIMRLKDKGMSNKAIERQLGIPEATIRSLLKPEVEDRTKILMNTANMLKEQVDAKRYVQVGLGVENHLGVSKEKLATAVAILKEQGYFQGYVHIEQVGMPGNYTDVKVLCSPDVDNKELQQNRNQIQLVQGYSEDGGRSFETIKPPVSVKSSRLMVRYGSEGGAAMDGVIELRQGVGDISLGEKHYAQVRIAVDGKKYLKGMAIYATDLPDGVDIRFNTNKEDTGNKMDALKSMKFLDDGTLDPENPFGAIIRQKTYTDASGKTKQSALNMVGSPLKEGSGEEGSWDSWSRRLSSQMLSKQPESLARQQLDLLYKSKAEEFDSYDALNNPAVKKKLLESFADSCDSASVKLHAMAMPRQENKVILPITSLKDNEIYAPTFKPGETVVLIRHPHGGKFEIPELKVNNSNPQGKAILGNSLDAVGINTNVAARLSGADFDGDTVIVIPNNNRLVKTSRPLKGLVDFSPTRMYPAYDGMRTIDGGIYHEDTDEVDYGGRKPIASNKQRQMGEISNLITDMTTRGANETELAAAVRHSMVVIDSEKHHLNVKQSKLDNGIDGLKEKYQGKSPRGNLKGASTLISKSNSEVQIPHRRLRKASEGGSVNRVTGEKEYVDTGKTYKKYNKRTGELIEVQRTIPVKRMALVTDANELSSGQVMETVYANHANKLKALANKARLEALATPPSTYSPSANKAYKPQVDSLISKLNIADRNRPLEKQAQILARAEVTAKKVANPNMESSEIKKINSMALIKARARVGASKEKIAITPHEWEAIQAGAISNHRLVEILKNTDDTLIKQYATPRTSTVLSPAKLSLIKAMSANHYTQSEIAERLGVSVSTINKALKQ